MTSALNPAAFKLKKNVELRRIEDNHIGLVKKRKSRIIMKDGMMIKDQIEQIREVDPMLKVSLIISGPICSKTRLMLHEIGVEVITDNEVPEP